MSASLFVPSALSGSYARSGIAWGFDGAGSLQQVPADAPALGRLAGTGVALGLECFGAAGNDIRNPVMAGAAIGSPGTPPTNWSLGAVSGLARQITSLGPLAGMQVLEVDWNGTLGATGSIGQITMEAATQIAAVAGDVRTSSIWLALTGGSIANLSALGLNLISYRADGVTLVDNHVGTDIKAQLTGTLQRFDFTFPALTGLTAFAVPRLRPVFGTSGTSVNLRLAIGLPQNGKQAFAAPPMRPASGAGASSRGADVATRPLTEVLYGLNAGNEMTVECGWRHQDPSGAYRTIWQVGGDDDNHIRLALDDIINTLRIYVRIGGAESSLGLGTLAANTNHAAAVTWSRTAGTLRVSVNGGAVSTMLGPIPADLTTLRYGHASATPTEWLNGWLRRLNAYPALAASDAVARAFPAVSGLRALSLAA